MRGFECYAWLRWPTGKTRALATETNNRSPRLTISRGHWLTGRGVECLMKTVFWLLLSCSLAQGAACPTGQMKNEAALAQIEETWVRVLEQGDRPALECILAPEFEEAGDTGQLMDRAQTLAGAAGDRGIHYELSQMHAHVYGDFGYIRGLGAATNGPHPGKKGRFTDIFVYRDGRWQCAAGHESHFP